MSGGAKPAPAGRSIRVLPGEFHVGTGSEFSIITVLGSCVAACIRNPATGLGGLNHFMLPEGETGDWNGVSAALRYGNFAMEALINAVLKAGGRRSELEAKLFGGASMKGVHSQIGEKNGNFARHYLKEEGIPLVATDLGGECGRRIHFWPATGRVRRLLLVEREDTALAGDETRYRQTLLSGPVGGDIDLFD